MKHIHTPVHYIFSTDASGEIITPDEVKGQRLVVDHRPRLTPELRPYIVREPERRQ